jgi:4-aminobutyrate aminotransferase
VSASAELSLEDLAAVTEPRILVEPPGPEAQRVLERDAQVTSPSLPRAYPFAPRRGSGSVMEDVDGNLYLDLNAGIAVNSTGHSHPEVVEAIRKQAGELIHYSASDFFLPIYSEVCRRLDEIAPMSRPVRSFLTNSGTEAVEASIKLARYVTGRQNVIGFYGAFHGRSYGSVSVTASKTLYRARFGPLLPGIYHAPFGDGRGWGLELSDPDGEFAFPTIAYIEKVLFKRVVSPDEVAAVLVEPILGEGGYLLPPDGWFGALRELCDRHGILLVADEVQSGMGRTGRMWAIEHFGVEPDVVLSGKGIASGMPLGAMIARDDLMRWELGSHGSTYGGSPTSCAAALASIDLIENGLMQNADKVGAHMLAGLQEIRDRHGSIVDVRGLGLMIGIEFGDHDTMERVEKAAFRRGLLMLGCGDASIRMSPPLVFREDQADAALRIFEEAVSEVEAGG